MKGTVKIHALRLALAQEVTELTHIETVLSDMAVRTAEWRLDTEDMPDDRRSTEAQRLTQTFREHLLRARREHAGALEELVRQIFRDPSFVQAFLRDRDIYDLDWLCRDITGVCKEHEKRLREREFRC